MSEKIAQRIAFFCLIINYVSRTLFQGQIEDAGQSY